MPSKPKRKHGLSRLERLLEASIRHELQIKALWKALREPQPARSLMRRVEAMQTLSESPRCNHMWDSPLSTIKWAVVSNRNSHKCTVCGKEMTPPQSLHAEFLVALCRKYPDIAHQNPPS